MLYMPKVKFASQPYEVGPKDGKKSLVVVIPAKLAKECRINTSTIFAIQADRHRNAITLQILDQQLSYEKGMVKPTGESFQASSQQVLSGAR
jgi:hypothetical protein